MNIREPTPRLAIVASLLFAPLLPSAPHLLQASLRAQGAGETTGTKRPCTGAVRHCTGTPIHHPLREKVTAGTHHRLILFTSIRQDTTVILYRPRPDDFHPLYEADATNQDKQSWEQYWRWVTTFYTGNVIARGWLEECSALLTGFDGHRLRNELTVALNRLGRRAVAEWAKDNGVRLISSRDIFGWRNDLRSVSRASETGTDRAVAILTEIERIESLILTRLARTDPDVVPPETAEEVPKKSPGSLTDGI